MPITVQVTSKKLIVPHAMLSSPGLVRIRLESSAGVQLTFGAFSEDPCATRGLSFNVSAYSLGI